MTAAFLVRGRRGLLALRLFEHAVDFLAVAVAAGLGRLGRTTGLISRALRCCGHLFGVIGSAARRIRCRLGSLCFAQCPIGSGFYFVKPAIGGTS